MRSAQDMNRREAHKFYSQVLTKAEKDGVLIGTMAELGRKDLFFLLVYILKRPDVDRDWLYERCREVEASPNGHLDLWAREHYKSTIITFGYTIQDVLCDPDITIGIFSVTRPIAKGFLAQIKTELTSNHLLKSLYPDVLYGDPEKQAPRWSLDDGLIVKRTTNPKESTIEAWGLVDSMPTGRHFKIRLYDDIITEKHITSPEMIKKAVTAWGLSLSLGTQQVAKRHAAADISRYAGTRYHLNDPYREIIERKAAVPRIHPGTVDGTVDGEPVLWSRDTIAQKRREMGPYIFGCQILQNPVADQVQGFNLEWIRRYQTRNFDLMNLYLVCDPANEKKKTSDYTVMLVIGLGSDKNYYLVDGIRDRLNIVERTKKLFYFNQKYRLLGVGYEKYGKDSDIGHIEAEQDRLNYHFTITPLGGPMPKNDRIRQLIPVFEQGRFYIPQSLTFITYENKIVDLIHSFIYEEYTTFPVSVHDDILDCAARILDPNLNAIFPQALDYSAYVDSEASAFV